MLIKNAAKLSLLLKRNHLGNAKATQVIKNYKLKNTF